MLSTVLLGLLAAPPLSDESFEQGTGAWNVYDLRAGHTGAVSSLAAHGGDGGFRFVDQVVNEGVYGPVLNWPVPLAAASGTLFFRAWVRFSGVTSTSVGTQFANAHRLEPGASVLGLSHLYGTPSRFTTEGNGLDDAGLVTNAGFGPQLADDGGWHLVEFKVAGLPGDRLETVVARDGVVVIDELAPFRSRGDFQYFELGFVYSYGDRFAGTLDVDDVRTGSSPLGSTLRVSTSTPWSAGRCAPITVSLVDSWDGGLVEASRDVPFALGGPGVEVFSDSSCQVRGATGLASMASSVALSGRAADAGMVVLRVDSLDFIGGALSVQVAPIDGGRDASVEIDAGADAGADGGGDAGVDAGSDAGTDGGLDAGVDAGSDAGSDAGVGFDAGVAGVGLPGRYAVGCGCTPVPGWSTALWILVCALAGAVRRRRLG